MKNQIDHKTHPQFHGASKDLAFTSMAGPIIPCDLCGRREGAAALATHASFDQLEGAIAQATAGPDMRAKDGAT